MICVLSTHDASVAVNNTSHPSMVSAAGTSSPTISIKQQVEEVRRLSSQAREAAQTGNYKEVISSKKAVPFNLTVWILRETDKSFLDAFLLLLSYRWLMQICFAGFAGLYVHSEAIPWPSNLQLCQDW